MANIIVVFIFVSEASDKNFLTMKISYLLYLMISNNITWTYKVQMIV